MFFRLIGLLVTLCLVGYFLIGIFKSDNSVIANNPAVQEQQKTLQQETGVNAHDQKALEAYTLEQAKRLEEYQRQQSDQQEK